MYRKKPFTLVSGKLLARGSRASSSDSLASSSLILVLASSSSRPSLATSTSGSSRLLLMASSDWTLLYNSKTLQQHSSVIFNMPGQGGHYLTMLMMQAPPNISRMVK